jgi:hypothetical protein
MLLKLGDHVGERLDLMKQRRLRLGLRGVQIPQ